MLSSRFKLKHLFFYLGDTLSQKLVQKLLVPYDEIRPKMVKPDELLMKLQLSGITIVNTRPWGYIIKPNKVQVNLCGVWCIVPNIKILGRTVDEIKRTLITVNKWHLKLSGNNVIVTKVEPLYTEIDVKELVNELMEDTPLTVLIEGLGYKLTKDIVKLMIPRLIPLVNPDTHVLQFTPYETGKTEYGLYLAMYFGWGYVTCNPTDASMMFDAQRGAYGYAVISEGIVFDELDKWNPNIIQNTQWIYQMPTWMEQGIMLRPVSFSRIIPIANKVPTVWFGNISPYYGGYETDKVNQLFTSFNVPSIVDRLTLVHVCEDAPRILDYVTGKALPPPVMIEYINELRKVRPDFELKSKLRGRRKRHSINIQLALYRLGVLGEGEKYHNMIDIIDYCVENGWETCWNAYLK